MSHQSEDPDWLLKFDYLAEQISVWYLAFALMLLWMPMTEDRLEHVIYSLLAFAGLIWLLLDPRVLSSQRKPLNKMWQTARELTKPTDLIELRYLLAVVALLFGSWWPDIDILILGIDSHRNLIFHSAIALGLLHYWSNVAAGAANKFNADMLLFFAIGLGGHLLVDPFQGGHVRYLPGTSLDVLWLLANAGVCFHYAWNSAQKTLLSTELVTQPENS